MVRFCNQCKRAIDDLDKFCRSCGHGTSDSIDYYTYYKSSVKEEIDQRALLWFLRGKDIAVQQEIKEIKEKVDRVYQRLFPPSVEELREDLDNIIEEEEEKKEDKHHEKTDEFLTQDDVERSKLELENHIEELNSQVYGKKEEEKIGEKPSEINGEIKEERKEGEIIGEKPSEINEEKKEEEKEGKKEEEKEGKKEEEKIGEKPPEINEEKNEEIKEEKKEEEKDWPLPEEGIEEHINKNQERIDNPQEVNDKLNMLLQEDEGQRQAVQYLINRYKNKDKNAEGNVDNNIPDNKQPVVNGTNPSIAIIPKEDVVRIGRARGKAKEKGEPYKMYDVAIHPFIPDILKSIESSKDGIIRVRLSDVARKMGENFVDKKPVTVYTGLKYTLFDHNIVVEMGSLKEVDPITKENIKILKMRMKNPDDMLPPSLLERRGEME